MATPETLRNDARCYDCAIPSGMFLAVMAYILQQTLDGATVSADPATLANDARCFDCVGTTPGMIIKELVDLNAAIGGGTGGSNGLDQGDVDPVAAPADQTKTWLYWNRVTGTLWGWHTVNLSWAQIV